MVRKIQFLCIVLNTSNPVIIRIRVLFFKLNKDQVLENHKKDDDEKGTEEKQRQRSTQEATHNFSSCLLNVRDYQLHLN